MFTPCDMRLKPDGGDPRLRFFDKRSDKSINESAGDGTIYSDGRRHRPEHNDCAGLYHFSVSPQKK